MRTDIQCPNCQGTHIHQTSNILQITFGLIMALAGLGFLAVAFTNVVGYYLFGLPLFTVGSICAYKGYHAPTVQSKCKDCGHDFSYMVN